LVSRYLSDVVLSSFLQPDLQEVGREKGWCPYFLARYAVSDVVKIYVVQVISIHGKGLGLAGR
jgi:hypothetical protein